MTLSGGLVIVAGVLIAAFCGFSWLKRPIFHFVPPLYGVLSYAIGNAISFHKPWDWFACLVWALLFYGFGWLGCFTKILEERKKK